MRFLPLLVVLLSYLSLQAVEAKDRSDRRHSNRQEDSRGGESKQREESPDEDVPDEESNPQKHKAPKSDDSDDEDEPESQITDEEAHKLETLHERVSKSIRKRMLNDRKS